MRKNDEEPTKDKDSEGSISDWVSGGPIGSKGAVLVFRSCVLASRTPSMESTTKTIGNNTGTTILLNKAKNMARRLVAEPHSFSVRPKTIMHDVMETFGNSNKFSGISNNLLKLPTCFRRQSYLSDCGCLNTFYSRSPFKF